MTKRNAQKMEEHGPKGMLIPVNCIEYQKGNRSLNLDDKEDAAFIESIREQGVVQAISVRAMEGGRYELLAGGRRTAAARAVGMTHIPALVLSIATDMQAQAVRVVENMQRRDLKPLEEAEAIADALSLWGSADEVARVLGMSRTTVSRRARLLKLSPEWKAQIDLLGMSVAKLEAIAVLEEGVQSELLRQKPWWLTASMAEFDKELDGYMRVLVNAPWELDDAELLPKAGSCVACPKQTGAMPGLFGAQVGMARDVPKDAMCTDVACWGFKTAEYVKRRKLELSGVHQGLILITTQQKKPKGTIREDELEVVVKPPKKADPTHRVGLYVDGQNAGKEAVVRPAVKEEKVTKSGGKTGKDGEEKEASEESTIEQKMAAHDKKRMKSAISRFRDEIDRMEDGPNDHALFAIACAIGLSRRVGFGIGVVPMEGGIEHQVSRVSYEIKRLLDKEQFRLIERLWELLKPLLLERMEWRGPTTDVEEQWEEARTLGGPLSIDAEEIYEKVAEEMPYPKAWAHLVPTDAAYAEK